MQKPHKDPHPVELLLLVGIAVIWAVRELLVTSIAVFLALQPAPRRSPARPAAAPALAPPAPPAEHPLVVLAAELEALPQCQLMQLAGTRRRLAKRQLAEMVLSMA